MTAQPSKSKKKEMFIELYENIPKRDSVNRSPHTFSISSSTACGCRGGESSREKGGSRAAGEGRVGGSDFRRTALLTPRAPKTDAATRVGTPASEVVRSLTRI